MLLMNAIHVLSEARTMGHRTRLVLKARPVRTDEVLYGIHTHQHDAALLCFLSSMTKDQRIALPWVRISLIIHATQGASQSLVFLSYKHWRVDFEVSQTPSQHRNLNAQKTVAATLVTGLS